MRRLLLNHTFNTRDLGGYPIDAGKATAYGKFVRSDVLAKVTDEDVDILLGKGITTLVDLRSDAEVEERPCALENDGKFRYLRCKIYGDGRMPASTEDVPVSYFEMVDEQKSVMSVMRALAEAPEGALYFCLAGKDRTGVVSALLLSLAGVPQIDISADYMLSHAYLMPSLRRLREQKPELPFHIMMPRVEYIESFFDLFYKKYRSTEEYLSEAGLTGAEITKLKAKLNG